MSSWFGDAWAEVTDPTQDEEQNTGDVPYARPLQGPVYGPPAPSYQDLVQQAYNQNPQIGQTAASELGASGYYDSTIPQINSYLSQQQNAASELAASGYYDSTVPLLNSILPGQQALQDFQNMSSGPNVLGAIGDAANFVGDVPVGGPLMGAGLRLFGVDTPDPSMVDAYNTRIPYVSDFMQNTVQPIAGDVGAAAARVTDPLGVGSYLMGQLGGPSSQQVGRFLGENAPPVTVGDWAVNAATAGGLGEALTGLPIDDLLRGGARALGDYAVRDLVPSPMAFERNAGRDALSQVRYPAMSGAAIEPWDVAKLGPEPGALDNWQAGSRVFGDTPTPSIAPEPRVGGYTAQEAYDAAYRATPGATADKVANAEAARQEVLSGEQLPGNYSAIPVDVDGVPTMPNRIGDPLAYDPTFSGGSGYRETIAPPPDPLARPDMARELEQRMEGGGLPEASSSVSPPPSSLTAEEIGNTMRQADINAGTNSQRIDQLISEARTPELPTLPLSDQEAIKEAARLNVPIDRGVFERGTPLARQQEMDLVSAARDLENSIKGTSTESRALDAFVGANKGEIPGTGGGSRGNGAGGAGGMGGGAGGATPPPGRTGGAGQGNLLGAAYRNLQELAYAKFGMDLSAGRQTVGRTMNPFYLPDTVRSMKGTAAAIRDEATGVRINDAIKTALEDKGITPKMADWRPGGDLVNREMGVSKFFNWIPGYEALNRGFATMVNMQRYGPMLQMIEKNANLSAAQLQHMADYAAIQTGRGTFGPWDKQIASVLGPVMTSARNAASWPERMAYLIPAQKVGDNWTLFGPTWQAAVKDTGGMIATGLGIMAISEQIGGKANYQTGDISFGDKHYNIWGGGYGWVKMAHDVYTGTKTVNGVTKDYPRFFEQDANGKWKGSLAEFFRNKVGPLPQETISLMRETGLDKKIGAENIAKFMSPDYWNDGVTGKNLGILDRAAQFATFLTVQDMAKFAFAGDNPGLNTDTLKNAAAGGAPSFVGISANDYHENTPNPLAQMRDAALGSAKYGDLFPKEQQALDAALQKKDPEGYGKALAESQSRQDPAIRANQVARDAVRDDRNTQIAPIVGGVVNGTYSPGAAYAAIKDIQEAASQKTNALLKDPAYLNATKDFTNDSVARRALDTYYAIPNSAKGPDGKVDWARADQLRNELIASIANTDPGLARRLLRETETPNLYEDLKKLAPKAGVR